MTRPVLRLLVGGGLGILLLLAGVRLLGLERGTLLPLLVGALPLSLLPAYPLLAAAVALRSGRLVLAGVVAVAAHVAVVVPALGADTLPPRTADAPRLRVVTANLYVLNPTPEASGRALRLTHPDVLIVPELSRPGLDGLRASGLLDDLPYSAVDLQGRDETVGLFSRLPLTDVAFRSSGARRLPRATVRVGGVAVRLLAAHPLPPIGPWTDDWRHALVDLRDEVQDVRLPAVVAGDLNSDRDHALFRGLLKEGLRDAHDSRGRGLARTWPASFPLLGLDHVLVRDGEGGRVVVRAVREASVPGSDHRAVVADLSVLAPLR